MGGLEVLSDEETDGYEDTKSEEEVEQTEEDSISRDEADESVAGDDSEIPYDWFSALVITDSEAAHFTKFIKIFGVEPVCIDEGTLICVHVSEESLWIAVILRLWGLLALVRYVGMGDDESEDLWINLLSPRVTHIYAAEQLGMRLQPPPIVQEKRLNLRHLLEQVMITNTGMLPNIPLMLKRGVSRCSFVVGERLEYIDYTASPCSVKVAKVTQIKGERLQLELLTARRSELRWCSVGSHLLRPLGWASTVQHKISPCPGSRSEVKSEEKPEAFVQDSDVAVDVEVGMKLEVIDPAQPARIFAACVKKVLRGGYMYLGVEYVNSEEDMSSEWFCLHYSSPYCLPVGFASQHKLPLVIPLGFAGELFDWDSYIKSTSSKEFPSSLLSRDHSLNRFIPGSKLEAVDLVDPKLVCVATVSKVVAHLLLVHFDGWGEEYDQWVPFDSADIFPVGWCSATGYLLTPPPNLEWSYARKQPKVKKKKRKLHQKPEVKADEHHSDAASSSDTRAGSVQADVSDLDEEVKVEVDREDDMSVLSGQSLGAELMDSDTNKQDRNTSVVPSGCTDIRSDLQSNTEIDTDCNSDLQTLNDINLSRVNPFIPPSDRRTRSGSQPITTEKPLRAQTTPDRSHTRQTTPDRTLHHIQRQRTPIRRMRSGSDLESDPPSES